jgi:hypothetical protein
MFASQSIEENQRSIASETKKWGELPGSSVSAR